MTRISNPVFKKRTTQLQRCRFVLRPLRSSSRFQNTQASATPPPVGTLLHCPLHYARRGVGGNLRQQGPPANLQPQLLYGPADYILHLSVIPVSGFPGADSHPTFRGRAAWVYLQCCANGCCCACCACSRENWNKFHLTKSTITPWCAHAL